jgi:hypothetical protein
VSTPLPLAAAALRLRGRPGRPRLGTARAQQSDDTRVNSGVPSGAQDSQSGRLPRLLDVQATANYLGGLDTGTVRELDASGVLAPARVLVRGPDGRPLRKVLFDVEVLDRLVAGWRTPA